MLGIDAMGKAFYQAARTVDLSATGARVTGLTAKLNPGDIVGFSSGGKKCHVKVVWASSNGDGTFQVGVQCLEKDKSPWRDKMQQSSAVDLRASERIPVSGSVSLRSASCGMPIWGTLRDISLGGCYVQCVNVPAKGEVVSGQFNVNDIQINGRAEVSASHAAFGMELQWCDLERGEKEKLNNVLRQHSVTFPDTKSGKVRALAQLEKLHQLVVALQGGVESNHTVADIQ